MFVVGFCCKPLPVLFRGIDSGKTPQNIQASLTPRKGIPAHTEIINSYLRGIEWSDGDVVLFIDCLPNRLGLLKLGLAFIFRNVF